MKVETCIILVGCVVRLPASLACRSRYSILQNYTYPFSPDVRFAKSLAIGEDEIGRFLHSKLLGVEAIDFGRQLVFHSQQFHDLRQNDDPTITRSSAIRPSTWSLVSDGTEPRMIKGCNGCVVWSMDC
jgi:hypothetical protein